jgi:hypothetical protein
MKRVHRTGLFPFLVLSIMFCFPAAVLAADVDGDGIDDGRTFVDSNHDGLDDSQLMPKASYTGDILIVSNAHPRALFGFYRATQMSATGWTLLQRTIDWADGYRPPTQTNLLLFTYNDDMEPPIDYMNQDGYQVYTWLLAQGYTVTHYPQADLGSLSVPYYESFDIVLYWNTYGYDPTNVIASATPFVTTSTMHTQAMNLGGSGTLHNYQQDFCVINNSYYPDAIYPLGPLAFESPMYVDGTVASGEGVALIADTCHPGACCFADGHCEARDHDDCLAAGGLPQDPNTTCTPNPCPPPADRCLLCGPGPHWVDGCAEGNDLMHSTAVAGIDIDFDPNCLKDFNLVLAGPVAVHRSGPLDDSIHYPGTRPLDQHVDVIDTEIVTMQLTGGGVTLMAGAGLGSQPLAPTLGAIAEQVGNPATAHSFFDVFFEVSGGSIPQPLYNQVPLRLESDITCIPPGDMYSHAGGCWELYTSPIPGQGTHMANLVSADHQPLPVEGACCLGPNCVALISTDCIAQEGDYKGDGVSCSPTPCDPSAVESPVARLGVTFIDVAPNPAAGSISIRYQPARAGRTSLVVFDASGRLVRDLYDGQATAGLHMLEWDGRDDGGQRVPAGVYFCRLQTEGRKVISRPMVLVE